MEEGTRQSTQKFECSECLKTSSCSHYFRKHIVEHRNIKLNYNYYCNHCNIFFSSPCALVDHNEICRNLRFELHEEGRTSDKNVVLLATHISKPNSEFSKFCRFCLGLLLGKHRHSYSSEFKALGPCICPLCRLQLTEHQMMLLHLKLHIAKITFSCEICGQRFLKDNKRQAHISGFHANTCQYTKCRLRFTEKVALLNHILHHADDTNLTKANYVCFECGKDLKTEEELLKHFKKHKVRYPCFHCSETFESFHSMESHIDAHHTSSFFCETCKKNFFYKDNYNIHSNYHTGRLLYKCRYCSSIFSVVEDYESHFLLPREVSYKCSDCAENADSFYLMQKHMTKEHNAECVISCATCTLSFTSISAFSCHKKSVSKCKSKIKNDFSNAIIPKCIIWEVIKALSQIQPVTKQALFERFQESLSFINDYLLHQTSSSVQAHFSELVNVNLIQGNIGLSSDNSSILTDKKATSIKVKEIKSVLSLTEGIVTETFDFTNVSTVDSKSSLGKDCSPTQYKNINSKQLFVLNSNLRQLNKSLASEMLKSPLPVVINKNNKADASKTTTIVPSVRRDEFECNLGEHSRITESNTCDNLTVLLYELLRSILGLKVSHILIDELTPFVIKVIKARFPTHPLTFRNSMHVVKVFLQAFASDNTLEIESMDDVALRDLVIDMIGMIGET